MSLLINVTSILIGLYLKLYVDKQSCFETPKFLNWPLYCLLQDHRKFAKNKAVSKEMSDLVVYCSSKPFEFPRRLNSVLSEEEMEFIEMSSFNDKDGKKYMVDNGDFFNRKKGKGILNFTNIKIRTECLCSMIAIEKRVCFFK